MNKLLNLVTSKIGCGYVWGSQGQILSTNELEKLKKTFGSKYYVAGQGFTNVDASKWLGKQCFDCSGLVVWSLQQLGLIKTNQDYTASMIYNQLCSPISKDKLIPGDMAFIKGSSGITHVGIYAASNQIIEAKGTTYGVVKNTMQSGFNVFGRLKFDLESKVQEHEAQKYYDYLIEKGFDIGDTNFDSTVTRGDVIKLMAKVIGYK